MKQKKVLFLVNSTYQIIVAVHMLFKEYAGYEGDLIISDRLNDFQKLAKLLSGSGCFRKVWTEPLEAWFPTTDRKKIVSLRFVQATGRTILQQIDEKYDVLLFANINFDSSIIYRQIRRKNPALKVYMFEDGFGAYTQDFATRLALHDQRLERQLEKEMSGYHRENLMRKLYYRWSREVFAHVDGFYVFMPEAVSYKPYYPVLKLEKIDSSDKDIVKKLNQLFKYEKMKDQYDRKIIFFEESYFADGYEVNDVACVEKLSYICGKENIMIKIHPRNKKNRFQELGYKTNQDTFIPWEVIALNLDLTDKVLITIASGSAMTSLMNMGIRPKKIIMLMRCEDLISPDNLAPAADIMEHVGKNYPNIVAMPKTMKEFEMLCRKLKIKKQEG